MNSVLTRQGTELLSKTELGSDQLCLKCSCLSAINWSYQVVVLQSFPDILFKGLRSKMVSQEGAGKVEHTYLCREGTQASQALLLNST